MARVLLVNPPNHLHDLFDLAPPLGLMILAEIAIDSDWEVDFLDLSIPARASIANSPSDFYAAVTNEIQSIDPDVVALTSMGVNTHVSLEIARRIKEKKHSVFTIVGGPHCSSIHRDIIENYSWIDCVITGEGEDAFRQFLRNAKRAIEGGMDRTLLPKTLQSNPGVTPKHPHRAYDVIRLADYFSSNERRLLNYEGGRGCVFKCSFCYSPTHYHQVYDSAGNEIAEDWARLEALGARHIFMVQDNFTNNPMHAKAVCRAISKASLDVRWNGYATLPQLNPELIEVLAHSGCEAMYLGIDAVTPTQQESFRKYFYSDDSQLLKKLLLLRDVGVIPTCAFMIDLYDFNPDDAENVFRVAISCAANNLPIRINTFTRYPGSMLFGAGCSNSIYSEAKVRLMYDCPEVVCRNSYAEQCPSLFPFHSTEIAEPLWRERLQSIWLAQLLIQRYAKELTEFAQADDNRIWSGIREIGKMFDGLELSSGEQMKNRAVDAFEAC